MEKQAKNNGYIDLRIITKTILPPVVSFFLIVVAFWVFALPYMKKSLVDSKKETVKQICNTAINLVESHYEEAIRDGISEKESMLKAIEHIKHLRYGDDNKEYFWIQDMYPKMIMHPYVTELNGEDLTEYKDPNGKRLFIAMVQVCKEEGAGFVDYCWQWKDDSLRIEPKISYVKLFRPWGWIIGTGMYINDVNEKIGIITSKSNTVFIIVGTLILLTTVIISIIGIQREKERIRIYKALQLSRRKFKKLFELAPDPAILMSVDGTFQEVNKAFETDFGYSKNEIIGHSIKDTVGFLTDENRNKVFFHFRKILQGQFVENFILESKSKDNNELYFELNANPIEHAGSITGGIILARNITERKKAQDELLQNYERLHTTEEELKVSNEELLEVNAILEEQKQDLEFAKQKAEESDRLKSAFLSNMSHEIRTPMNGIIGFSRMLAKKEIDPAKRELFSKIIIDSSQQLLSLVNDVLDISKIEAGQMRLSNKRLKVNALITDLALFYGSQAKERNLKLNIALPDNSNNYEIYSDPFRVKQVFNNLISNALKFTQKGDVCIGYTIEDGFYRFFVKDTGIGIPQDMLSFVFERFRQVEIEDHKKTGGTGLGLSIAKKLVELLGGEIGVKSTFGKGSEFYFKLPAN